MIVRLESIVGRRIERVLDMHAIASVDNIVGVGKQGRPLALGKFRFKTVDKRLSLGFLPFP